jgi:hypothetical protein
MKNIAFLRWIAIAFLAIQCALGCGNSESSLQPTETVADTRLADTDAAYGIDAYVTIDGKAVKMRFGSAPVTQASPSAEAQTIKPLDVAWQIVVPGSYQAPLALNELARMALSDCQVGVATVNADTLGKSCLANQRVQGRPYDRATALGSVTSAGVTTVYSFQPPVFSGAMDSCAGLATTDPFLYFYHEPKTAQHVLQYQEILVCAANKLSDLADSDRAQTWTSALYGLSATVAPANTVAVADVPGFPIPKVTVPCGSVGSTLGGTGSCSAFPAVSFTVVKPKDRFLVRDLAMELLSYVPLLDQFPIPIGTTNERKTASQLFGETGKTAAPSADNFLAAYNIPVAATPATVFNSAANYYPPLEPGATAIDWQKTARKHLEMESANLRASSQLMQELINKNVTGSLSAMAARASQLPFAERASFAWQRGTDGNSMSEVARVLFGRLGTLGMKSSDTALPLPKVLNKNCKGGPTAWVQPNEIWNQFAPVALTSRGFDVKRANAKGVVAEKLLVASRLGFANGLVTDFKGSEIRLPLYNELKSIMAADQSVTPAVFEVTPLGQQLKNQVDGLSDENLRTAVLRQRVTLENMANKPLSDGVGTFNAIGLTTTAVPATSGIYRLSGALERNNATGDIMALMAPLQNASECTGTSNGPATDFTDYYNVVNGDPLLGNTATAGSNTGRPAGPFTPRARSYQFQDAFAVAQALRDRMVRLRYYATNGTPATVSGVVQAGTQPDEDVQARDAAIFENEAWAGSTRVIIRPMDSTTSPAASPPVVMVSIVDADPKDFGLADNATPAQVLAAFGMAFGFDAPLIAQ